MNIETFTEKSKQIVQKAQLIALSRHHQQFLPEHLLYAMLQDEDNLVIQLLGKAKANIPNITSALNIALSKIPEVISDSSNQQLILTSDLAQIFQKANEVAKEYNDSYISLEIILEAMLISNKSNIIATILRNGGLTESSLKAVINDLRKGRKADSINAESKFDALKKYAKDITQSALESKLDPVIGRDEEIRRTMQVLSRKTKNNPILIGEPGVGKTAIVEGLAQRIVANDVPESLKNVKIMCLDLGALIAGAKFRGEFEERFKSVLYEVTASNGNIILFIDEMHIVVGAGSSEGSMDASNLLKPALARGELHCIGATTLNEYRKYIEKDAAFARRLQPVYVNEPSIKDTISILRGLKERYEVHHGIRITNKAIEAAVYYSDRYIENRFLPDKAIDLIDEAASRLRIQVDSKPEVVDEVERKIMQLKIELLTLQKETDDTSQKRLEAINVELKLLEQQLANMSEQWNTEKFRIGQIKDVKAKLEKMKIELDTAQRDAQLEKAGELRYGIIPTLEKELAQLEVNKHNTMLQESVSENDIASIVAKWTGIPVERIIASEKDKLLKMEEYLEKLVVGQHNAVVAVSNAVRRARAGLADEKKPIGSFLFLGPTGVGKTELTKALAQFLFDDEKAITRMDMSEYMEKHAISRLIGAPPGYVGYEEGGTLTEAIRRRPYQLILFDEIEKAHPDVFNILLQVLDEGRLTDGQGRTVNFCHSVIILTSNLGSQYINDTQLTTSESNHYVMETVRQTFKPEFINRLDEIIIFNKLLYSEMNAIVDIQTEKIKKMLLSKRIILKITDSARNWLSNKGYDVNYGARPLKRVIQNSILNKLSELFLSGQMLEDHIIEVKCENNEIIFVVK